MRRKANAKELMATINELRGFLRICNYLESLGYYMVVTPIKKSKKTRKK